MKIIFYFGHPAQYLFLRATIQVLLKSRKHKIIILIKTKDVLEDLLKNDGIDYINILSNERRNSKFSIILSLLKRLYLIFPIILKEKPDLLVSTDASLAQLGKLLNINRISITEDDYKVVRSLGRLTYPFTQTILCPKICNVGRWESKKIGYEGYMKLGYLHPAVFQKDSAILEKYSLYRPFVILRLAKLTAHHDFGAEGLTHDLIDQLITLISSKGFDIVISSEAQMDDKYSKFFLRIRPNDMHQILAAAALLVCDSQSMTVEAAILGIPSIRYSSFIGKISVLEELEHVYGLTNGIAPGQQLTLLSKTEEILSSDMLKKEYQTRQQKMLAEKINVTPFLIWFIENYPTSISIMKKNPNYQFVFQ